MYRKQRKILAAETTELESQFSSVVNVCFSRKEIA